LASIPGISGCWRRDNRHDPHDPQSFLGRRADSVFESGDSKDDI
jgi:hypothetical protein